MNWFTGIMVYVIVWWVVLFTVLPFGVKPAKDTGEGHMSGAPEKPKLVRKAIITSLIAAVVFAAIYGLIESDLISFYRMEN